MVELLSTLNISDVASSSNAAREAELNVELAQLDELSRIDGPAAPAAETLAPTRDTAMNQPSLDRRRHADRARRRINRRDKSQPLPALADASVAENPEADAAWRLTASRRSRIHRGPA